MNCFFKERRQKEREEEEKIMEDRRRVEEERRKADEAARKAKAEAQKARKEEEKRKKQAMMAGMAGTGGKANFEVPKKGAGQEKTDQFGNIVKAKDTGMSKEQHEEAKKKHLENIIKPLDTSSFDIAVN